MKAKIGYELKRLAKLMAAAMMALVLTGVTVSVAQGPLPDSPDVSSVPVGGAVPFAGDTAPPGWLVADGSAIDATAFPELCAVLGNTYGSAPTGKCRLPDLRGRVAVGEDDGSGRVTADNELGDAAGQESFQLTEAELPEHSHGAGTLSNSTSGAHDHGAGTLATESVAGHDHGAGTLATNTTGTHDHGAGTLATDTVGPHDHDSGTLATSSVSDHEHGSGTLGTNSAGSHTHGVSVSSSKQFVSSIGYLHQTGGGGSLTRAVSDAKETVSSSGGTDTQGGHSHSVTSGLTGTAGGHGHSVNSGTTGTAGGHGHAVDSGKTGTAGGHGHSVNSGTSGTAGGHGHAVDSGNTGTAGNHGHSVSGNTGTAGGSSSGSSHATLQPYLILNYIIHAEPAP